MANNSHLNVAKKRRNDEFYTQRESIERELKYYEEELQGKVIYCNCDDYRSSQFYEYFKDNFRRFGLKELISSNYSTDGIASIARYNGFTENVAQLKGTGNYTGEDDEEILEALEQADVVITNPPFSLFKEYIPFLVDNKKDFIVLGSINAVTYVDIFPFIRDGIIIPGNNFNVAEDFIVPEEYAEVVKVRRDENGNLLSRISNIAWYSTFPRKIKIAREGGILYDPELHPQYDNYDAIEVSRVKNIPKDYRGVMGVPVNFLASYNPDKFIILGSNRGRSQCPNRYYGRSSFLNGKETYKRIFIKRVRKHVENVLETKGAVK